MYISIYIYASFWVVKGGLTKLPPSVSRLSTENVIASMSHKPMGLHGLLEGYLYILLPVYASVYIYIYIFLFFF
jgi:hypothetical protein